MVVDHQPSLTLKQPNRRRAQLAFLAVLGVIFAQNRAHQVEYALQTPYIAFNNALLSNLLVAHVGQQ